MSVDYKNLSKEDMLYLMKIEDDAELFKEAYKIKLEHVGREVYYRGLIEISNICVKDCLYCGIRKSSNISRYSTNLEEILERAQWAYKNNYGSITLQSGERSDVEFVEFIEDVLMKIKKMSNNELGITLSLGEQTKETYKKWFDAGAHRYLLRIETTNEELYNKIHPNDLNHNFKTRLNALKSLKEIGYQVGSGVMIGIPEQKEMDLVNDIIFFKDMDLDMIGMGPYVVSEATPLGKEVIRSSRNTAKDKNNRLNKSLKMIALTRLYLKDINIASTTALQTLDPKGREKGLLAGANILMPIITVDKFKKNYQLYDGKPCLEDASDDCKQCLAGRIDGIGEEIGYNKWGDSPHFKNKKKMFDKQ
ncbi:MAG: [FeFe] hydrogenase H-cluster radical SAM maturase HydE [Lachnospirales bacterium]